MNMKCIESISLETHITSKHLVEICKSNRKLRILWIRFVEGELEDIVPHATNLEEISFPAFASNKSYVAVAKLPKIRKVRVHSYVSLKGKKVWIQMFDAFASKGKETHLESLEFDPILNFEETSYLIRLVQLKELDCRLQDEKCIDLLKNLTELKSLSITVFATGTEECLNVLKSCRKLQRLFIYSYLEIDFVPKAMAVLKSVRNPEKQKPLELYLSCLNGVNKVEKVSFLKNCVIAILYLSILLKILSLQENLVDRAYCILQKTIYVFNLPWKLPN